LSATTPSSRRPEGLLNIDLVYDLVYISFMVQVNIHEAKTHFSKLLARVSGGEEVLISKSGKPIARLVPYRKPDSPRVPGLDRGLFVVPADFNAPLPSDIEESFER
jgi:prevent-host-death family protein